jgi:2-dehydro-3-deoxygalactonokinase
VSPDVRQDEFVGINWGSSNFRAYRIAADGGVSDEYSAAAGIATLDRGGMAAMMQKAAARWPGGIPVYAAGMIGSAIGWVEVPYADAPAGCLEILQRMTRAQIGEVDVRIVPGIACRRAFDGAPDILRGEEIELLGLIGLGHANGLAALPGTHTKWVRLDRGRVVDFFTAMSGEIFDRLTAQGLLASITEGEAAEGAPFLDGVAAGQARKLGLGTLLFGARARVIRGALRRADASSYVRGLLIGSEIADALAVYPELAQAVVPLTGSGPLSRLYAAALTANGIGSRIVDSREACRRGFRMLHEARLAARGD